MRFQSLKHSPTTLTLVLPLSRPPELLAIQIYTSSFCHVTFLSSKITVLSPFTNTFPFLIHATSGAGTPFDQQSSLTSAPNTTDCSEVINITLAGTDHIEFKNKWVLVIKASCIVWGELLYLTDTLAWVFFRSQFARISWSKYAINAQTHIWTHCRPISQLFLYLS